MTVRSRAMAARGGKGAASGTATGEKPGGEGGGLPAGLARLARGVIFVLLLLAPQAFAPPTVLFYNSLDTPRRLLLLLGAGVLTALVARLWAARRRVVLHFHYLDVFVLLYLLGAVAASVGGECARVSFFGPLWCQDSLLLLWIVGALYFGIKECLRTPAEIADVVFAMVLAGGISSLLGLGDFLFGWGFNPNFERVRLVATLGNPMFTGTYLAMIIPLAVGAGLATRDVTRRWIIGGCLLVLLPALQFTQARAAWLGFAAASVVLLGLAVWQIGRTRPRLAWQVLAGGLVLLALMAGAAWSQPSLRGRILSIINRGDSTLVTRLIYMETSWNMFKARPVTGVGVGNLKAVFPQYRPSSGVIESGLPLNRGYSTALPHNIFLQVAAETGLLGLAPYLLTVLLLFITAFRTLRGPPLQAWLTIGIIGSFVVYFVANSIAFDCSATTANFWALAALLTAFTAREVPLGKPSAAGAGALGVLSVGLLILGLLQFSMQFTGATSTQRGVNKLAKVQERRGDPNGGAMLQSGIQDIKMGAGANLVPDSIAIEALCLAHKMLQDSIDPNANPQQRLAARDKMFHYGEETLRLNPRDPIVSRYLLMEYSRWGTTPGVPAEEQKRYLQRAEALVTRMETVFEPHSAEVRLLHADLLASQKRFEEALKALDGALVLDISFAEVWIRRANILQQLANPNGQFNEKYTRLACEAFANAYKYGLPMREDDKLTWATNLYVLNSVENATMVGRLLWNTPQFATLEERIGIIGNMHRNPAEVAPRLAAVRHGMPAAPPPGAQQPPPGMRQPGPSMMNFMR